MGRRMYTYDTFHTIVYINVLLLTGILRQYVVILKYKFSFLPRPINQGLISNILHNYCDFLH